MKPKSTAGFTLTELLIALYILGVIATFTIPKVLQAQQSQRFQAVGKEAVSMISGAYQAYTLAKGSATANTSINDLLPYMNYVKRSTTQTVDDQPGSLQDQCRNAYPCLVLHSGGTILYEDGQAFGGTASTNGVWFHIDPDGQYSGTTNGTGKAVGIFLYYNGRLTSEGYILPNTMNNSGGPYNPDPSAEPAWFSW